MAVQSARYRTADEMRIDVVDRLYASENGFILYTGYSKVPHLHETFLTDENK